MAIGVPIAVIEAVGRKPIIAAPIAVIDGSGLKMIISAYNPALP